MLMIFFFLFYLLYQLLKKPDAAKEVKYEPFSFPDGTLRHDTDTVYTF